MTRTNIINALIRKFKYKSYLEIGVQNTAFNFDKIECDDKIGIDPKQIPGILQMTSDAFFEQNSRRFDLVFVDGLHHHQQAYKDVVNALGCLTERGTVVMHDCNPTTEEMQRVPLRWWRSRRPWTGDVWKAWVSLRANLGLDMFVVDTDYGVGIVRPQKGQTLQLAQELTWANLSVNRKAWLELKSVAEFQAWLESPTYTKQG